MKVGTRAQVMHGTAERTSGGLTKKDLKYNKNGRIVSKKQSENARKNNRLVKAGYVTKKGQFGSVKVGDDKSPVRRRSAARRSRSPRRSAARRSRSPRRSTARRSRSPRRSAARRSRSPRRH